MVLGWMNIKLLMDKMCISCEICFKLWTNPVWTKGTSSLAEQQTQLSFYHKADIVIEMDRRLEMKTVEVRL